MLTPEKCWEIIEGVKWGTTDVDYDVVKTVLSMILSDEETKELHAFVEKQKSRVYRAYREWCEDHPDTDTSDWLGPDSTGDLLSHIVGLGKAEVEACVADPKRVSNRVVKGDFTECFDYCIPWHSAKTEKDTLQSTLTHHLGILDRVVSAQPAFASCVQEMRELLLDADKNPLEEKEYEEKIKKIHAAAIEVADKFVGTRDEHDVVKYCMDEFLNHRYMNYCHDVCLFSVAAKILDTKLANREAV